VDLKELKLDGNGLDSLPDTLSSLHHLERLDISHNLFEAIPPPVLAMTSIHALNASHNQLSSFPDDLSSWVLLSVLDLGGNPRLPLLGQPALEALSLLPLLDKIKLPHPPPILGSNDEGIVNYDNGAQAPAWNPLIFEWQHHAPTSPLPHAGEDDEDADREVIGGYDESLDHARPRALVASHGVPLADKVGLMV